VKSMVLDPAEFVEATRSKGHLGMRIMDGSAGRTWECDRCGALVYRESGTLRGWALEYTCNEVDFTMNSGGQP
jgi:predicted RNA-binding Zn-ribbon protein involved in translation (DUF1610 family)